MPPKGLHTDQERADVLALDMLGIGPLEISKRSGVALSTVKRWVSKWADVTPEERDQRLLTAATELALRYQELQHKLADAYEDMTPAELVKHAANINNAMGTNTDKVLAITSKQQPTIGSITFAVYPDSQDPTPTIEGQSERIE